MTDVSAQFFKRWKSGLHIGPSRPVHRVFVRHGEYHRGYHTWDGPTVRADIYGESRGRPWYPKWTPMGDWEEIPNIESITLDQDFEQDGTTVATITLGNTLYREATGVMGMIYHLIEDGALSPMRGYKAPKGVPYKVPAKNDWADVLVETAQIKVYQGYGLDCLEPTFVGFIDKVTPKAKPTQLTLSCRCVGGKVLNDGHVFGWNVSKQLPEPLIFKMDPRKGKPVGFDAKASSHRDGHPARFVTDSSQKTAWISSDRDSRDNTEWVQVHLRRGTYSSFAIQAAYPGMQVYVGIYARSRLGENSGGAERKPPTMDGAEIPEGWVDLYDGDEVPGDVDGGWHYVRRYNAMSDELRKHDLPGVFELGDNSILRIGFRRLHKVGSKYRASVTRLQALKDPPPLKNKKGTATKVVTIDDPSDIIRCCLRWAGFEDWKVDDTGVTLKGNWVFTRESTYMDVINKVREAIGNYIFYVEGPSDDDDSMGLPVFRQNQSMKPKPTGTRTVRDRDLLTELDVNLTDEPKSYIIRVRGRGDKDGLRLGAQTAPALMAVYRPPWSASRRMSRIIRRHFTHTDPRIKTQLQCEVLARLIAYEMALQGATATAVVPGTPEFDLDDQVGIVDTKTGTATRLYVVRRSSEYVAGQEARWFTTIGGSLIDNRDVYEVKRDLLDLFGTNSVAKLNELI